jgi:mannan endo-1,4-beta-mannosidase
VCVPAPYRALIYVAVQVTVDMDTPAACVDYLNRFQTNGWPVVIGEFGWRFNSGEVDHETILSEAQARGLGYLGWSWSGNTDPILDMATNFDPAQLTTWGQRVFNANGIKATAREATIFGGTPTTPVSTPPVTTHPSPRHPSRPRRRPATYSATASGRAASRAMCRSPPAAPPSTAGLSGSPSPTARTSPQAWNATVTTSGSTATARNVTYNGSLAAGTSTNFGFLGSWNGSNGAPTLSCTAG